jgi:2-dehydro-3-deoxygalactonokinase
LGTTHTRLWRVDPSGAIVHRAHAPVGVRDTAREQSDARLRQTLRTLIDHASAGERPSLVIAAGMITSALGLKEIPHIPAPAGLEALAAAVQAHVFTDVTALPVLLVPGVRCGHPLDQPGAAADADLMRGEETLCVGLMQMQRIRGRTTVLNLGSHWKSIQIDEGMIVGSATSLAGEMIHALHTSTILASALPKERPQTIDRASLASGMRECGRSGLGRTLFTIRLLELQNRTTPQERYAYCLGAFIAGDVPVLLGNDRAPVLIVGDAGVAAAWREAMMQMNRNCEVVAADDVEQAMIRGLRAIAGAG